MTLTAALTAAIQLPIYDTNDTCFDLEARWSLHPIFTRVTPRNTETLIRGGQTAPVCDGQPSCACGPMKFYQREGFYSQEQRALDGLRRGAMAPDIKRARIRWHCPNKRCKEISTYFTENPRDHTWWPRRGKSHHATHRRAYTLYRNLIEASFAETTSLGISSANQPPLWARDTGMTLTLALHNLLATAHASRTPTTATWCSTTSTNASACTAAVVHPAQKTSHENDQPDLTSCSGPGPTQAGCP